MNGELSHSAHEAIARLRDPQTRIYLGARYGLTPQTYISPEKAKDFLDMDTGRKIHEPLCDVAHRLGSSAGRSQLTQTFANRYSDLEEVQPEAREELELLRPIAAGKVIVTGSYSSALVASFTQVTLAVDDSGVSNIRPRPDSQNTYLMMLHGQQAQPGGVLLSKQDVDGFEQERERLSALLRELLHEQPWVVLGFDQAADGTFFRLCWDVCKKLGLGQRPIYVVDPREWPLLASEWPKDPLRHVRMRPLDFLRAFTPERPSPPADEPPADEAPAGEPPGDEPPSPPADTAPEAEDDEDKHSRPRPGPDGGSGLAPEAPRRVEVQSVDGRVFRVSVPGTLRVSALAGQFVRRHVHGEEASSRQDRAVVELQRDDRWHRLPGDQTVHEAGVEDDDRMRVHSEAVAGTVREAQLTDIQMQLEELADHDERVTVRPNLPRASDRYEITLRCGGWGPPESAAAKPYRTEEQRILLEYPAEFPDAPPLVWWKSAIFHPNVRPKDKFVCLGALQERFTPLFGPRELVQMLIELSEYRNYELDGVLNREAAVWAQLRPELLVEHGGWPYQPTLEDDADDEGPALEFEPLGTGVGLKRRSGS